MTKKSYGFVAPEITPDMYMFGSQQIGFEELQPNGQWDDYLPVVEIQRQHGLETYNCTVYGTNNAIEILAKRVLKEEFNFSERYLGIMAGTTEQGNDPHKVIETFRNEGGIPDALLPWSSDIDEWDEYYSPKPMTAEYDAEAKRFLQKYKLWHDWVFVGGTVSQKQKLLMAALKSSPICVSVDAWAKKGPYYVKEEGAMDNHWCTVYGYKEGKYWKVFDHYDDTHKKLAWDYDFGFAKRYRIEINTNPEKTFDFAFRIWDAVKEFFNFFKTPFIDQTKKKELVEDAIKKLEVIVENMETENKSLKDVLLELAEKSLGTDVSPQNKAPQELSCAEGLSNLLYAAGAKDITPSTVSTIELDKLLESSKYLKYTKIPKPGCVIMSPRQGETPGHVGLLMTSNDIASNTSKNGLFEKNYTIDRWIQEMRVNRKLKIYFYEPL